MTTPPADIAQLFCKPAQDWSADDVKVAVEAFREHMVLLNAGRTFDKRSGRLKRATTRKAKATDPAQTDLVEWINATPTAKS